MREVAGVFAAFREHIGPTRPLLERSRNRCSVTPGPPITGIASIRLLLPFHSEGGPLGIVEGIQLDTIEAQLFLANTRSFCGLRAAHSGQRFEQGLRKHQRVRVA